MDDLPSAKARLTKLEKDIEAKEKELGDLKAEADALRKQIAAAEAPKDKVYRKPEELFADMPKAAYPKFGADAGIERDAARKWANKHVVGRIVEWTATVTFVTVDANPGGDDLFTVTLSTDMFVAFPSFISYGFAWGGEFAIGGEPCGAIIYAGTHKSDNSPKLKYASCTVEEAKALRTLKGKKVALRATIYEVEVGDGPYSVKGYDNNGVYFQNQYNRVPFGLTVTTPSVDVFLPASEKPKDKK